MYCTINDVTLNREYLLKVQDNKNGSKSAVYF